MPLAGQYGVNGNNPLNVKLANTVLLGQYVASLRIAADRGNCDVYLMPLGGGVFENKREDIAESIVEACDIVGPSLRSRNVTVQVLAWSRNKSETEFGDLIADAQSKKYGRSVEYYTKVNPEATGVPGQKQDSQQSLHSEKAEKVTTDLAGQVRDLQRRRADEVKQKQAAELLLLMAEERARSAEQRAAILNQEMQKKQEALSDVSYKDYMMLGGALFFFLVAQLGLMTYWKSTPVTKQTKRKWNSSVFKQRNRKK